MFLNPCASAPRAIAAGKPCVAYYDANLKDLGKLIDEIDGGEQSKRYKKAEATLSHIPH